VGYCRERRLERLAPHLRQGAWLKSDRSQLPLGELDHLGWPPMYACSLGEDVVAATGDLPQLLDGFVKVAPVRRVPHAIR
jgi:hypothetical protein